LIVDRLPLAGQFRAQLDSLRAFAVMGVILSHTSPQYTILQYIRPGDRGVQLFFVLSGFLISGILFEVIEARGASALRTFFARRVLRLLPLFYLVLAITAVVSWDVLKHSWPYHAFYLSNYHFLSTGGWEGPTDHLWTLALEEQFYLVWPVILVILPTRYWRIGVIGLLVLGIATRGIIEITDRWQTFGSGLYPTYYADAFGGGAAIALWLRSNPTISDVRRVALTAGLIGAIILVLIYAYLGPLRASNSTFDVTGWMMICIGLILSCYVGFEGLIGRWLEKRPLVAMGKISYGIYLWHVLAIFSAQRLLSISGLSEVLGRFSWIMIFVITTLLSIVFAWLSWHFIESRILTLKSKLPYRNPTATIES